MKNPFHRFHDHNRLGAPLRSASIFTGVLLSACTGASQTAIISPTLTFTPAAVMQNASSTPTAASEDSTADSAEDMTPAAAMTSEPQQETGQPFDPAAVTLALQPVTGGLRQPLFATHAGDGSGRLFIVEKAGQIRIFSNGVLQETPFLNIPDRVNSSANEQGLLGLAFAPNFVDSGYFFVNYTNKAGETEVARFSVPSDDPNVADPASHFTVLTISQPAPNHNGGMVLFGPDGYLYIGTGDGGAANDRFGNGQNPASLLGKMLRIDVTADPARPYVVPADNPWLTMDWNGADVRDEIWAVGVRNPWRYSFDRQTGDLWIADVGQNQFEEVNFVAAASPGPLNFGWPIMEASNCFSNGNCDEEGLELPVVEYNHAGHCSVTGGYVYRGARFPALTGAYLYGDYCSGVIWALAPDGQGGWTNTQVADTTLSISSFAEDETGELYVTDLSGGTLYQIVDSNWRDKD